MVRCPRLLHWVEKNSAERGKEKCVGVLSDKGERRIPILLKFHFIDRYLDIIFQLNIAPEHSKWAFISVKKWFRMDFLMLKLIKQQRTTENPTVTFIKSFNLYEYIKLTTLLSQEKCVLSTWLLHAKCHLKRSLLTPESSYSRMKKRIHFFFFQWNLHWSDHSF